MPAAPSSVLDAAYVKNPHMGAKDNRCGRHGCIEPMVKAPLVPGVRMMARREVTPRSKSFCGSQTGPKSSECSRSASRLSSSWQVQHAPKGSTCDLLGKSSFSFQGVPRRGSPVSFPGSTKQCEGAGAEVGRGRPLPRAVYGACQSRPKAPSSSTYTTYPW